jgi:hypothetical protein
LPDFDVRHVGIWQFPHYQKQRKPQQNLLQPIFNGGLDEFPSHFGFSLGGFHSSGCEWFVTIL